MGAVTPNSQGLGCLRDIGTLRVGGEWQMKTARTARRGVRTHGPWCWSLSWGAWG